MPGREIWLALLLLGLLAGPTVAQAQIATNPPSRPILLVHGWCGSADDWVPLYGSTLLTLPADLYPDKTVFWVQYDAVANVTHFSIETNPLKGTGGGLTPVSDDSIRTNHPAARIFVLAFYDPISASSINTDVAKISILNKAFELSQAIKHITAITQVPQVNILAHSMGGLDARAYVENMASPWACYDYYGNAPKYSGNNCAPGSGSGAYANDVANVITVDTPHNGSPLAYTNAWTTLVGDVDTSVACQMKSSTNKSELAPLINSGPGLLETLNYSGSPVPSIAARTNGTPIQAVMDVLTDVYSAWDGLQGQSDDVVQVTSQSIRTNVPAADSPAPLTDLPVGYLSSNGLITANSDCWIVSIGGAVQHLQMLHSMKCLGALPSTQNAISSQLIQDTIPWVSNWGATAASASFGGTVTFQYSATDYDGKGLSQAELWRAPDVGGPAWTKVYVESLSGSGMGPSPVTLTDTPTAAGVYWYGTHLMDLDGNMATEPSKIQVTVTPALPPKATPTVLLTVAPASITTAHALAVVVSVSGASGGPTPAGSVVLTCGNYTSGAATLSNGTATITVPAGSLAVGNDSLTVNYTPSATSASVYNAASGFGSVAVSAVASAPVITNFTATPSSVNAGATITYNVTLSGPAPTGGAPITFTSSSTSIIPSSSFSVLGGATSGGTTAVASSPQTATAVMITASYNGSSKSASVTVNSSATATYLVTLQATGAGRVTSEDGRFNCYYATCSAVYAYGSSVTLTEVPGTSYAFSGWGGPCTGLQVCSFTVVNNMLVTATFSPIPGTIDSMLTTTVAGSGSISSTDGLVNCSTSCQLAYPNTASVILNAIPNPGWAFSGWTEDCAGRGQAQCALELAHNTSVQATFSAVAGSTVMAVSPGTITTIAGNGTAASSGDGGPAALASLDGPFGASVDSQGNVYIAEFDGHRIRVVNTQTAPITIAGVAIQSGDIATVAGNGTEGFSGDGGPSTSAQLSYPTAVRFDASGNLYIVDADNYRIRAVNLQSSPVSIAGVTIQPGAIATVAGNGAESDAGDGGPATGAGLYIPEDALIDGSGNIYIGGWDRIRLVNGLTGTISTFAGGGSQCFTGCSAGQARLTWNNALARDSLGNLFFDSSFNEGVTMVYAGGSFPGLPASPKTSYLYNVAGTGSGCPGQSDSAGDGCLAINSVAYSAVGLATDLAGSVYFASNSLIHRIDRSSGLMTAVAGNGSGGYVGDGVPATSTAISLNGYGYGSALSLDARGNLYLADTGSNRVRKISSTGAPVSLFSPGVGSQGSGVTLSVENAGASAMNQPTISISGASATEFGQTTTCNSSVQPGASCTITVTFTPAALGTRTAQLNLASSNASNSPEAIPLIGNETGATGTLSLSTTAISFGTQPLGASTAIQTVSITNTGSADMPAPAFSIGGANPGAFSWTDNCQAGLKAGASCTVAIAFVAAAGGAATATLSISDSGASNSPQQVTLTGGGAVSQLSVTKTHSGSFTQGQTNATYTVTVSNAAGAGAASGTVTVTEAPPPGLTLVSMAGTGWTCPSGGASCTRSDSLAAGSSYPVITVTVNVAANAASPQVNSVSVAGGGSVPQVATDSTVISVPLGSLNILSAGPVSAAPGGSFSVPLTLSAASGVSVGALTFAVQITPVGGAPALNEALSFSQGSSIADTPFASTGGTLDSISVIWASFTKALSGASVIGAVNGLIPSSAATGQSYTVTITGASAASPGGTMALAVQPGTNATISVVASYRIGEVYPYSSDSAPNFGHGALDITDLISELFAVNGVPGFAPTACSDRFDAMDLYPVDTSTARGGDGVLDIRDLILELFRVNNLDMSRPVRASFGGTCAGKTGGNAVSTGLDRKTPEPARARTDRDAVLSLGRPEASGPASERVPIYLQAVRDLNRIALTLALGDQVSQLRFVQTADAPPSLADSSQTGVAALAWTDGLSVRAGETLLLGYVEGPTGFSSGVKAFGASACGVDNGQDVLVDATALSHMEY